MSITLTFDLIDSFGWVLHRSRQARHRPLLPGRQLRHLPLRRASVPHQLPATERHRQRCDPSGPPQQRDAGGRALRRRVASDPGEFRPHRHIRCEVWAGLPAMLAASDMPLCLVLSACQRIFPKSPATLRWVSAARASVPCQRSALPATVPSCWDAGALGTGPRKQLQHPLAGQDPVPWCVSA
jgi:hypothetical protein